MSAGISTEAAERPPPPPVPAPGSSWRRLQRVVGGVVLVLMGVSAAYSANARGLRDRYPPPITKLGHRSPASPVAIPEGPRPVAPAVESRSQPWWQELGTLSGQGATTTEPFTIDRHALQWRVRWRCESAPLSVVPVAEGGQEIRPIAASGACPEGTGFSVRTGRFALRISTAGPWEVTVEQQVDVPMVEPPLPAMASPEARVLATGAMYDVDRVGKGTVRIHALPDGSKVLRLEDFFVSINSDLEIWLSELPHPRSTPEAAGAPHLQVSFLKATAGAMNYALPDDVDVGRYRSIVIWCELTRNAYAAAALVR